MKRNILLALAAALTISLVATGVAFAQGYGPGGSGMSTGNTVTSLNLDVTLSNYMPAAMADVLGLGVDEIDTRLASGETFYMIALSMGYTTDQLAALVTEVHTTAINLAVADGVVTADQASLLLNNQYGGNGAGTASMFSAGTGTGAGLCDGICIPQNLSTVTGGSMMRRGGSR